MEHVERQDEREAELREDLDKLEDQGDKLEESGDRLEQQVENVRQEVERRKGSGDAPGLQENEPLSDAPQTDAPPRDEDDS